MSEESHSGAMSIFPNTAYDVVVIGASAGGLKALSTVLTGLPVSFPAAVVVVQHLAPTHPSQLAEILGHRTPLAVKQAQDGDVLRPSCVYIAPPDYHLIIREAEILHLSHAEAIQYVRPSATLLFASAAEVYGSRVIGVILTGTGSDGSVGAQAIKRAGGKIIAQDETTSEFFGMPGAAISTGDVDLVLPLGSIAAAILALVSSKANDDQST